jgi:cobalt/nickel transport system permease protein
MLLVRSFERSERIRDAMRCRGFNGRFHLNDRTALAAADLRFAAGLAVGLAALGLIEGAA